MVIKTPTMKAPFQWFGGKSRVADLVWERFGDVPNYVEPFFGSGAVLLGRPHAPKIETVNDRDGFISNFWRAVKDDPETVAHYADWPVNECCPAGTEISTPLGNIPIEAVANGTVVWGWDGRQVVPTVVTAVKKSMASEFVKIGHLTVTPNHPVWTEERGYIPAGLLGSETLRSYNQDHESKQTVDDLWSCRSENIGNSLRRSELQKQGSIPRTFAQGSQGKQDARLLLDSISHEARTSANIPSVRAWNGDGFLAGSRDAMDCQAEHEWQALQSHQWRRRDAGVYSNTGTKSIVEQATQGEEIPSRQEAANAGHESHRRCKRKDQQGRTRASAVKSNAGADGGVSEAARHSFRSTQTNDGEIRPDPSIRRIPKASTGDTQYQEDILRTNWGNISVSTSRGGSYWKFKECSSVRPERISSMQRVHLPDPVAVYNFQTTTGNYFAAGILVHNCDLHARHIWLLNQRDELTAKLEGDPHYYDAKIAGWWVWGQSCWIAGGWCSGNGPWNSVDGKMTKTDGQGVKRQLPHLGRGKGVHRSTANSLVEYMQRLAARLRRVRVCCGDWSRVAGPAVTITHGITGVFLDPPYTADAGRDEDLYAVDCLNVGKEVFAWAIANGNNPLLRIAVCGYEGEYDFPSSWECVHWKTHGGMANIGNAKGKENRHRERIWFSPHCLRQGDLFAGTGDE